MTTDRVRNLNILMVHAPEDAHHHEDGVVESILHTTQLALQDTAIVVASRLALPRADTACGSSLASAFVLLEQAHIILVSVSPHLETCHESGLLLEAIRRSRGLAIPLRIGQISHEDFDVPALPRHAIWLNNAGGATGYWAVKVQEGLLEVINAWLERTST